MKHPVESDLALFAGGDLGFWEWQRVQWHVGRCADCCRRASVYQKARKQVEATLPDVPKDINWNRLSQEITGNIRVGLAAGEAIAGFNRNAHHVRPRALRWNAVMVIAGACVVFCGAFWLNLPPQQADHLITAFRRIRTERVGSMVRSPMMMSAAPEEVVLEASRSSIQVKENGGALSLMHPRSDGVSISVSMQGSAGVRYVDSDTGQVTMNRVYYAQP